MKSFWNFLRENLWVFYLGGSLSVFGLTFMTLGYWVVIIPTIFFVVVVRDEK